MVKVGRQIGTGSMKDVYECEAEGIGKVAMLRFRRRPQDGNASRPTGWPKEAVALTAVEGGRGFITALLGGVASDAGYWDMLVKLAPHGPLDALLENHPERLPLKHAFAVTHQMAHALTAIASAGFVHADVAARNVLVYELSDARIHCQLSDFGTCMRMKRDESTGGPLSSGCSAPLSGTTATRWAPPEMLHSRQASDRTDVWSFGVLGWEIFSSGAVPYAQLFDHPLPHPSLPPLALTPCTHPFLPSLALTPSCHPLQVPYAQHTSDEDLADLVASGLRLARPPRCPLLLWQDLDACWAFAPTDRPTAEELCRRLGCARTLHATAAAHDRPLPTTRTPQVLRATNALSSRAALSPSDRAAVTAAAGRLVVYPDAAVVEGPSIRATTADARAAEMLWIAHEYVRVSAEGGSSGVPVELILEDFRARYQREETALLHAAADTARPAPPQAAATRDAANAAAARDAAAAAAAAVGTANFDPIVQQAVRAPPGARFDPNTGQPLAIPISILEMFLDSNTRLGTTEEDARLAARLAAEEAAVSAVPVQPATSVQQGF